jgi:hypothetical protein
VFHTGLNLSGFEPKSSSNKHFFQQFLSTRLGGIPAHELSNVTDSTMNTPFVFVVFGIFGLVNETNLGFVDHQDVEVGKRTVDSDPAVAWFHGVNLPELAELSILGFDFYFGIAAVKHDPRSHHVGNLVSHDGHKRSQQEKREHYQDQHADVVGDAVKHKLDQFHYVDNNHGPQGYLKDHALVKPQPSP